MKQINAIDVAVIIAYLVGIVGAGVVVGLRNRKGAGTSNYFLASHTLRWPSIGLALFATNISCLHLVSLAQAGYDSGLLMGNFEWLAAFALVALSLFFVPFYMRAQIATLPDFLEKRYSRECRDWLAGLSMLTAIIFNIAFPLTTGWLVLHGVFGMNKWVCIISLTTLTAIYTTVGGLSAVVATETIQALVLLAGSVLITALALNKCGGWGGMAAQLHASGETVKLTMLRSSAQEPTLPWYAAILGYPALSIWYWCADQTIVQRVLGAKDENHARIGPLFCGLIKVLPVFLFILPGLLFLSMIEQGKLPNFAQVRYQAGSSHRLVRLSGLTSAPQILPMPATGPLNLRTALGNGNAPVTLVSEVEPSGLRIPTNVTVMSSKETYGILIRALMPPGLFGVMAAALMAALMGNLASAANSIATLFSFDLYRRFRPAATDRSLVTAGRLSSIAAFVVGIALVPVLDRYKSIFAGVNDIIAHIAPPISCVFALGVFWPRASAFSARWTMWLGSLAGALVFTLKTVHTWSPDFFWWIPQFFYDSPFMLMAFYLLVFCVLLQVALTFARPKTAEEDPSHLYWRSSLDALRSPGWPGLANYKVLAGVVIVVMCTLYVWFR